MIVKRCRSIQWRRRKRACWLNFLLWRLTQFVNSMCDVIPFCDVTWDLWTMNVSLNMTKVVMLKTIARQWARDSKPFSAIPPDGLAPTRALFWGFYSQKIIIKHSTNSLVTVSTQADYLKIEIYCWKPIQNRFRCFTTDIEALNSTWWLGTKFTKPSATQFYF